MFSQLVLESHIPLSESFLFEIKIRFFPSLWFEKDEEKIPTKFTAAMTPRKFPVYITNPPFVSIDIWTLISPFRFLFFWQALLLIQTLTFLSPDFYKPKSEVLPLLNDHIRHSLKIQNALKSMGRWAQSCAASLILMENITEVPVEGSLFRWLSAKKKKTKNKKNSDGKVQDMR